MKYFNPFGSSRCNLLVKTGKITRLLAIGLTILGLAQPVMAQVAGPARARSHYDVAAFVWPSYSPDKRARGFWPMGIGEWETVMNNEPKFPGQNQPRRPLWGYVNEADRYVMEMQIAAAADHGVNVFIYDWYWYDGMPYLEGCLNDGYLKARNNDRVKFYLMWANHDVRLAWDKRNADDVFTNKNNALIWRGWVGREEFEKIAHRWIQNYFSQPTYYRIDDKPVFMLYDLANFIKGMGGVRQAKEAITWFRGEVAKAGFKGLELQVALTRRGKDSTPLLEIPGETTGSLRQVVEEMGFDSVSHYQYVHFVDVDRDYQAITVDAVAAWEECAKQYSAKYYPHVSVGWDASPRAKRFIGAVVKNNPPEEFEKALVKAREFIDARPGQAPLIVLNSWNEWTETSYLEPDEQSGYGYLEAVQRVFKR